MARKVIPIMASLLLLAGGLAALQPPSELRVRDIPDDDGTGLALSWRTSPDDADPALVGYSIKRAESAEGPFEEVNLMPRSISQFTDGELVKGRDYYFRIDAVDTAGTTASTSVAGPIRPREEWFKKGKINILLGTILFIAMVVFFLERAKRGSMFLRRLAGLDAVEEAVGRATEMGKPILYILGTSSISDIATIAGLNILGQVARKTAEYETPLLVPTYDFIVHAVAREVVKEGYNAKGRPDLFNEDMVFFLTDNQMGYAAGCSGIMARERPATNLFMGMFYAESLILAEAGAATGAIQIAGTDAVTQLPFFVTACDYTLMGEELYAASAYLSKEPLLVGTIKAQDFGKVIIVGLVLLGSLISVILGSPFFYNWFSIR
jgi:hypothetical protein